MSGCSRFRKALFIFSKASEDVDTVREMRWITAFLIALVGTALFLSASPELPRELEDFDFDSEPTNIGLGRGPSLPIDQPISATLFFSGGAGRVDDPYRFCLRSVTRAGAATCLFDVLLVGPPSEMEIGGRYQVVASFERMPGEGRPPLGDLISASGANQARTVSFVEKRGPRFQEKSEVLSNWSAEHDLNGHLRLDGAYVWYLTDEARAGAIEIGILARAVWADLG